MYKVLRKFQKHIDGSQLPDWPKPLQNRVAAMVQKMKGAGVAETPLTVKLCEDNFLRVEIRGENGWYIVYEKDGTGSFEPHAEVGRYPTQHDWAFYTP
jgi:hypothetical protein